MEIAIDFDGTCVTHEFPKVGKDIGAVSVLKELAGNGHKLILFTMRSNCKDNKGFCDEVPKIHNGDFLDDAVNWFKDNEIPLYGIQCNPSQLSWTTSPKCYAKLYIDDAALGCPLVYPKDGKPYVNWTKVREILVEQEIIIEVPF